jgi:phospholipid/cholesterol/gamma-HCH transport system substrate-binding protein
MSEASSVSKRRVRVGIFVVVGVVVLFGSILLVGKSRTLFLPKATLHTSFTNIAGLAVGAPVRLAGYDIGIVKQIAFDKDPGVKHVNVTLQVQKRYLVHVRRDSIAEMASKGLLGDSIINISLGSEDQPELKDGDGIESREAQGLNEAIAQVEAAIGGVNRLTSDVDERVRLLITPQLAKDFGRMAHSAAGMMEGVEKGPGLAHAIIYDPELTRDTRQLIAEARSTVGHVNGAVADVEGLLTQARTGPGLLHGLIYDKKGEKTGQDLERVANGLGDVIQEVKTGRGMLHSLIYEDDKTNLIENLTEASRVVKQIATEVNEGKGTLGGLLKDPTVYEDLTTVLGNIKRNMLLKALIRFTIEKDDLKKTGQITDTVAPPAEPPSQAPAAR